MDTMELYENKAEDLCETRSKNSATIRKYISEITKREIQNMKQMKFEKSPVGHPETKLNFENRTNSDEFLGKSGVEKVQCDDLQCEITKLKVSLQRMKPE